MPGQARHDDGSDMPTRSSPREACPRMELSGERESSEAKGRQRRHSILKNRHGIKRTRLMDTLFISDLHLSTKRPDKIELFRQFFDGPARKAGAVYILGDLFEHFWTGNDDRTPPAPEVAGILRECCRHNNEIYLVRGNRDLMLDRGFSDLTGCKLLGDATVIDIGGKPALVMHGDLLCTRDVKYQWYRKFMETPLIRRLFLSLPYSLRILLTRGLKPLMKKSASGKPPEIIDVDQATVEAYMSKHGVDELIHGHTHRSGIHDFDLNGEPARRIVLGDWYEQDSVLVCRDGERKLLRVSKYLES